MELRETEYINNCPMDESLGLTDIQVLKWCKLGCSVNCKELAKDYIKRCIKKNIIQEELFPEVKE